MQFDIYFRCLSGTSEKVMINSDKVCSVTVTNLQFGGMGRTQISRGTADRENLSYPVRRNKWGETEHCTGNSCNLGNGQFGPDNGIAPVAPPNENHHCLCKFLVQFGHLGIQTANETVVLSLFR